MLWVNVTPLHGLPFHKPAIITTYNPSINESLPCSLLPIPLTHTINTHTHHGSRTPQKNHVKLGRAGQIGFRLIPNTLNCIIDHKTERLWKSNGGCASIQSEKQEYQWVPREHGVLCRTIHNTHTHI